MKAPARVYLGPRVSVPCSSLVEASTICRAYIVEEGIGSSRWRGGAVVDADGAHVGRISYNGRAWSPDDRPDRTVDEALGWRSPVDRAGLQ